MLRAGNTFYSPTPDNRIPHLSIVLSDPDDDGFAICASVTSAQDDSERTTVCKKGDHPLISHESVIFYVDAHEIDMIAVDVALGSTIQGYTFRQEADCDSLLLERVRAGMVVSQNVSEELQEYCEELWPHLKPATS